MSKRYQEVKEIKFKITNGTMNDDEFANYEEIQKLNDQDYFSLKSKAADYKTTLMNQSVDGRYPGSLFVGSNRSMLDRKAT